MTGRRTDRSTSRPTLNRPVRAAVLSVGALAVCASIAVGCGVVPGTAGGSGDDTITVMTWAPQDTDATNKPGMPAFAQAYARWVNARGGIAGRKLRVLTCNDHNDSVAAAKCSRIAVKRKVVAVVGSYSQHSDSFLPSLEAAGIPYIGGYGLSGGEFTSPLSYPVNGGQPTLLAGLGKELAAGCGSVVLVRPDNIAGDALPPMLDSGLKAGGHAASIDQQAADDATEYEEQARRAVAASAGDTAKKGCVIPALGDRTSTFMDSFRRARENAPDVKTAAVLGSVDQTEINESGGRSGPYEGSYITGWYPAANDPRWDGMKKVISRQAFGDNRIDAADAGVQTTWIAYTVFRKTVESLGGGNVTSDTVRRALDHGLKVTTGGLTPPLEWEQEGPLAAIGLSRLVNDEVTLQVVRQGQLVAAKKGFLNVTGTLKDADVS
ncbi:ABC transporter substrate-binding protein [Streptomyces sp. NPDC020490]|uniref:ABC transporter substrate-binding protein n=1 Tax=Streptomyces sp. NPDC020490 TaxID=3365078 RepID=UPI0037916F3B